MRVTRYREGERIFGTRASTALTSDTPCEDGQRSAGCKIRRQAAMPMLRPFRRRGLTALAGIEWLRVTKGRPARPRRHRRRRTLRGADRARSRCARYRHRASTNERLAFAWRRRVRRLRTEDVAAAVKAAHPEESMRYSISYDERMQNACRRAARRRADRFDDRRRRRRLVCAARDRRRESLYVGYAASLRTPACERCSSCSSNNGFASRSLRERPLAEAVSALEESKRRDRQRQASSSRWIRATVSYLFLKRATRFSL